MDRLKEYWNNVKFDNTINKDSQLYRIFSSIKEKQSYNPDFKVLEIWPWSWKWLFFWKDYNYSWVDYAPKQVETCHSRWLTNVIVWDARELPYEDNTFDFIYSLWVIEHFHGTEVAVKEHARVCKKGGDIFISVPNKICPIYLERLIGNLLHKRSMETLMVESGKRYTMSEIRNICENNGIVVDKIYAHWHMFSFPKVFNKIFTYLSRYFGHMIYIEWRKK